MNDTTLVCPWCRGRFEPNRGSQKYCTKVCRQGAAARRWVNKTRGVDQPATAQFTRPRKCSPPPARNPTYIDYLKEAL